MASYLTLIAKKLVSVLLYNLFENKLRVCSKQKQGFGSMSTGSGKHVHVSFARTGYAHGSFVIFFQNRRHFTAAQPRTGVDPGRSTTMQLSKLSSIILRTYEGLSSCVRQPKTIHYQFIAGRRSSSRAGVVNTPSAGDVMTRGARFSASIIIIVAYWHRSAEPVRLLCDTERYVDVTFSIRYDIFF